MSAALPSVWLNELTWENVATYLQDRHTAIIPIGSTEQHGPAGPLGLDTYVAIALAEDAAKQAGVIVTPPIWFGDSTHHMGFPGSISLRTETVVAVVQDVSRSLARHGFRRILVINGHKGANLPALTTAVKNLHEYELPEVLFAIADPLHIARGIARQVKETPEHHAGELEMSHCWYKFPHLVQTEKFSDAAVDFAAIFADFVGGDLFGGGGDTIEVVWNSREQRRFAPTGQFTSTTHCSQAKGKEYHDHMVARLVQFLNWWQSYQGPLGQPADTKE